MKVLSASLRLGGLILFCSLLIAAQIKDFTRHVNPFIGTGGHGHTFPGATMPFGMVQLSPDTRIDNWDGSSGYHYSDDIIYGFSHTHLSGTGIPDGCDILFMPTVGEPHFFAKAGDRSVNGYASKFSHVNERAEPGYYSVKLDDDGILAEMTATTRVGFHRYTFPRSEQANIILDLKWRDKVLDSEARIVGKNRIEGYRRSSSWAKDQVIYFVAEFSKPFNERSNITENITRISHDTDETREDGSYKRRDLKASFSFVTIKNEQILLKVAISPVSIEGARKNLEAELPGWDFDKVRADAKAAWNKELSKIEVSGGTDAQTTNFYTALYHTMIQPNVFNDVDGRYKGHDGKIHRNADAFVREESKGVEFNSPSTTGGRGRPRSDQYTVFSLWDTFRAAHPLYTIIDQKRTVDFINTFIRQYEQGGRLPVWELWGEETDTMIGYHAVSVIADAMAKGIKGFDYEKAFEASKHSAELDHFGLAAYKKRGYISMEDENESVSKTLEYAYNDWCIAQMALELAVLDVERIMKSGVAQPSKYVADADKYLRRARYFENLFEPETGFFRPKQNGRFVEPFAPNEVTFHFTEGNSWQYSFFVPHDTRRLIELMGGREKFVKKLDELFTTEQKLVGREQPDITGLIGQYAHGNEPSHHIAYLYNYAGEPWKTQKTVRQILDEFYKPTPDGLIGNEDCGQMSAWYILSASGFYPVTPGSSIYAFGTPLFKEMKYNLENGKKFTIKAPNVSAKNFYIKSARLNGKLYERSYILHEDVMNGGMLEFEMMDTPSPVAFKSFPVSEIKSEGISVPLIEGSRVFNGRNNVAIKSTSKDTKIFYTTDGTEPGERSMAYKVPLTIDASSTVRAIAIGSNGEKSLAAEARFYKRPNDWNVTITSKYSTQYTGGGDDGLIDGIRGTVNFASGEWQGYQAQNFEAMIDMRRETVINKVGGSFLQVASSWIWMPERIEFEASNDGREFTKIAEIKTDLPTREMKPTMREFLKDIAPVTARYVRVKAFNFGKIPAWHPGAGGDPWIFVDEIFVK